MAQTAKNTLKNETATPSQDEANRSSTSLFGMIRTAQGAQTFPNKPQFMSEMRQRLAQLADEAAKNGEEAASTENLAASLATKLYQARIAGMINGEELSGVLVDVFGAVPKQDGTPGKTPAGAGGTIRKRIVRAVQGYEYINGGDGGRFFETMDADAVRPVIQKIGRTHEVDGPNGKEKVLDDGCSIWNVYKELGDIKSQNTVRLPFAFDPKKIIGLTESLSEAGARERLLSNPTLGKAYAGLFDQLLILNQVDASEVDAVKAALGVEDETETDDGEEVAA